MDTNRHDILVLGGTGFIGRHLLPRLVARGATITVPTRRPHAARELLVLPRLRLLPARITDEGVLEKLVPESGVVINLVGILAEGHGPGTDFQTIHTELTRRVLAAATRARVRRYLHVSALGAGADPPPSRYLASKKAAEELVRASPLAWTILRPAVVAGPDGGAALFFARLLRLFPLMPLARASARLAPVAVGDVAEALVRALEDPHCSGRIYELGGPQETTLQGFVEAIAHALGRRVHIVPLPDPLAWLEASLLERLPGHLLTRDQLRSLTLPGIPTVGPGLEALGILPTPLAAALEGLAARLGLEPPAVTTPRP